MMDRSKKRMTERDTGRLGYRRTRGADDRGRAREAAAWHAGRDRIRAKGDWQFTTGDARVRLKRRYPTFGE